MIPLRIVVESGTKWWEVVLSVLTALGTVGAVIAALYIGVFRDYIRRPKLSLTYDPTTTDLVIVDTNLPFTDLPQVAYARLKVIVIGGRNPAEDVQAIVLGADELEQHEGSPARTDALAVDGQLLTWSETDELTTLTIPPTVWRHIDLLSIRREQQILWAGTARHFDRRPLIIEVSPKPTDFRFFVLSRTSQLDLVITARNADPQTYRVTVTYDGDWGDDREDVRAHLTIAVAHLPRARRTALGQWWGTARSQQ